MYYNLPKIQTNVIDYKNFIDFNYIISLSVCVKLNWNRERERERNSINNKIMLNKYKKAKY